MGEQKKPEDSINQMIEQALACKPPKAVELNVDELQSLEQSVNIYHSELLYQNEELNRINQQVEKANGELEEAKNKYQELYDYAPVSYVILDLDGVIVSVNRFFCKMLGVHVSDVIGKKISCFVAPESQDTFHYFILGIHKDIHYRNQLNIILSAKTGFIQTEVYFNSYKEKGDYYLRATIFDVSKQKKLLSGLNKEKERYRIIAEQAHDILFEYDMVSDTMSYSRRFVELTGMEPVISGFMRTVLSNGWIKNDDIPKFRHLMKDLEKGKKDISCDLRISISQGTYMWYRIAATVLHENKIPVLAVGTITNVEDIIREKEQLRQAARTDSLTKLYNKDFTGKKIQEFLQGNGRIGKHALFIIDIDNFKYLNDHLGHLFGDAVLMEVSNNLIEFSRPGDIAGRIGGDEFVLLLKNCDETYAMNIAEDFCKAIKNILVVERADCDVSASIGICCYPQQGLSYVELFKKADIALYNAKGRGKNCCELYGEGLQQPETSGENLLNSYDAAEPHQERRYTNLVFVTNIIEILFEGRNAGSSIRLVLSLLGDYFKADHVCLIEDRPERDCAGITYEWYPQNTHIRDNRELGITFSREIMQDYGKLFDNEGLFLCTNPDTAKREGSIWNMCEIEKIKTTLEYGWKDEHTFSGFIAVNNFESERDWQQEDINSFMLIGKTIGAYLAKLRIMERTKHYEKFDMLTQAWNLNYFTSEAELFLKTMRNFNSAVICLDISDFKFFNDLYGYAEGDKILKAFSKNIEKQLCSGEMFARVSADQFVMLLNYVNMEKFRERLDKLALDLSILSKPTGEFYRFAVIVGVCPVNPKDDNVAAMIDRANIARKSGKKLHKSAVVVYEGELEQQILRKKIVEDAMESALANGEFFVEYQPKVLLADSRLMGAEALIRWVSPQMGKVYPDIFIPVVEKNGFVIELDFFVLEQVCRKIKEWEKQGFLDMVVSVNFSRRHIEQKDSAMRAKAILDKYGVPPAKIEVEITESVFTEKKETLLSYMEELKRIGFSIAMDDFGTGYSSLNLLKELPIDVLKLDRQFFQGAEVTKEEVTKREKIVITNVVKMAKELEIVIVTEGVETAQQAEFLREIGCEIGQGYLFARPMPVEEFEKLMQEETLSASIG